MEKIILDREQIQDPLGIYFWPEHKGRYGCRTPFPWNSGEPNQGFNQGAEPWLSGTSPIFLDQAEEMQESTLHLLSKCSKSGNPNRRCNQGPIGCICFRKTV